MLIRDAWPDLRHVRYVVLSPQPPGTTPNDLPFASRVMRNAIVGASAIGSIAAHTTGHVMAALLLGGALGASTGLLFRGPSAVNGFALVPWGVLLDEDDDVTAIRWSGIRAVDVRYRAARDGSIRTRVEVDSVRGALVGWASDAVDVGALSGNLDEVVTASARPIAVDLDSDACAHDGEPFVERILDSARRLVQLDGERRLGLEPRSYRDPQSLPEGQRTAGALRALGIGTPREGADPWGLIAAVAGELRLLSFAPELARLANAPHPGVAAVARAALGRMRRPEEEPHEDVDALSWFVQPDELARLCAWRDA